MLKKRKRRRAREAGFRDALVLGSRDPSDWACNDDTWKVAYDKGFAEGERVVGRIVRIANNPDQAREIIDRTPAWDPL